MLLTQLRLYGEQVTPAPGDEVPGGGLTVESVYRIGSATRGIAGEIEVPLRPDQILELVFEDDTVWMTSPESLEELFPEAIAQQREGAAVFRLPTTLPAEGQQRGLFSDIALRFLKIFVRTATGPVVHELARTLEDRQLGEARGLCRLANDFSLRKDGLTDMGDRPCLLFLHGTASSTAGSFAQLKGTEAWKQIRALYGENVAAFQHETLTRSPLQNVKDLVEQLPSRAVLHLVSHSRGGLVGDILCRYCISADTRGFSDTELHFLSKNDRQEDIDLIGEIQRLIFSKNITIGKFIRVACPASGTTLASKRLDHFFNIVGNLLGLATGQIANPVYIAFKELLSAVVATKDDTSALPGLEAQDPGSPFSEMLNNAEPAREILAPLIIIAGNSGFSLRWKGLLVITARLFYLGKNDFVVDTRSMYNGARRNPRRVQYFLDESPEVSHFNYFVNAKTRAALLLALQNDGIALMPGFDRIQQEATEIPIRNALLNLQHGEEFRDEVSGRKEIAVLLPGIMGSNLAVKENRVWINYLEFLNGGLTLLEYSPVNNENVRAQSLIRTSYKDLADHLERQGYDVVTFPFDWRLPLDKCADTLNNKLLALLEYDQPIKLIGHSMGGVLLRDLILQYPRTWEKLNQRKGFRLLFLGAPLGGSFRIPYVLFGEDPIIRLLAGLDLHHTRKELLQLFGSMPGLLCLLPLTTDAGNDLANPNLWENMRTAWGDAGWPLPSSEALAEFGRYRDEILRRQDGIDYSRAVYIAGQSREGHETIKGWRTDARGKLEFISTKEGDESVTWESGIPASMIEKGNVYYSDACHGELAHARRLFKPITDILRDGNTNLLKKTRPILRGATVESVARSAYSYDRSPQGIENTLLGLASGDTHQPGAVPISLSVTNGDLKYARFPVLAGHFSQDGLFSGEKKIDGYLAGELGRRIQLGLYAGEIGTSELLGARAGQVFKGALIVGLGLQGELTTYLLTRTVELAVARYLALFSTSGAPAVGGGIGLTAMAIGCGYGGLGMENSVRAVLQGVQNANDSIRAIYPAANTVDEIEFIENLRDRALSLVHAIQQIENDENRSLNIVWKSRRIRKKPGSRDRLPIDQAGDWWTRIHVWQTEKKPDGSPAEKPGLHFALSTNAAREEEKTVYTARETVMKMLEDMSTNNRWNPAIARAVYELLIPYDFKETIKRQNNIAWIVDKWTAAYPWELLQDGGGKALPLSVNAGMIRQLATREYRLKISLVTGTTALVIGDPNLEQPRNQLPGALAEAKKVTELLSAHGYTTLSLFQETAGEILTALFTNSYNILHLAGHGIFNADPSQPSGMLIGKNAYLTTGEISQMSVVPELVFVNCCYLGKTDGEAELLLQNRYQLAASIGVQLIEIGVKAVIVAGWAVDDGAGLVFAEKFYECMLAGIAFGEATLRARKLVYDRDHQRTNTWGAYQCYGDPFYRFRPKQEEAPSSYAFAMAEEAEIELSNLQNRIDAGEYDEAAITGQLLKISAAVDSAGLRTGVLTELEAFLYIGLNRYKEAIDKFEELFKGQKAAYSGIAMEKYCNVRVKYALQECRKDPSTAAKWINMIDEVIAELGFLQKYYGETVERLNLLGSAWKRKAMMQTGPDKEDAYRRSAGYYRQACDPSLNDSLFYSLTSWLYIAQALLLATGRPVEGWVNPATALEQLKQQLDLNTERLNASDETRYWDLVAEANLRFCLYFLGDPSTPYAMAETVYQQVWQYAGHQGDKQSEIEMLDFLADILGMVQSLSSDPGDRDRARKLMEDNERLRERLQASGWTPGG